MDGQYLQLSYHDDVEADQGKPHPIDLALWMADEKYRRHIMLLILDDVWDIARHNEPTVTDQD